MKKHQITALVVGSSIAVAAGVFAGTAFAGAGAGADCDKTAAGGHGPGARFGRLDTDKDGKVSLGEFSASREDWLTRVDTNKDGVATRAEIDASFEAGRKEHTQNMFTREDANKDGRLTREETRMPSAWFERADTNNDGALTITEAAEARNKAHAEKKAGKGNERGHGKQGGKMSRLDENGDGKVERQELKAAAAQHFTRLDKNADGSLSNDELGPAHGRGHGRHRGGPGGRHESAPAPAAPVAPTRG
jgi:Ca2+-binding EF-hand superfamily protein